MKKSKLEKYIEEVDEFHGDVAKKLINRIDQLEYTIQNLQLVIEKNCSDKWINKPIHESIEVLKKGK
jgi:hypothetical protein